MSKPRKEDEPIKQLATWVPADVKDELKRRAQKDGKAEREVVTEALVAHLSARRVEDGEEL